MSFHGGLLGVLFSSFLLSKQWGFKFFEVMDFIAPYVPIGLGSVRIGNFLNSELLGRPTEVPWGVIFPSDPLGLVRHASQLYQAVGEGIVLLLFMLWYSKKPRPNLAVSSMFLIGYGVVRCFTEAFREPDAHIGFDLFGLISRGQVLSIPMIAIGLVLLFYSYRNMVKKDETIS
jgi:phosphatidylglycerol:prolipoprotein diacylglycerol transferase